MMKFWMVVGLLFVGSLGFSESLKLSLKTGNLAVSAGGGKAYVLITVQATSANIQNRSPINLSLVLDRSGSMAGKTSMGTLSVYRRSAKWMAF